MMGKFGHYDYYNTPPAPPLNPRAKVLFVDNSGNPTFANEHRFLTLASALDSCLAERGDVIYIGADHAENIPATDLTLDVNGVTVIGLGKYANRPTFTYTATGSTVSVTADDVTISGIDFTAGIADVAVGMTVTGEGCTVHNCRFRDTSDPYNIKICIQVASTTDNEADGFVCDGCYFYQSAANDTNTIKFAKNTDEAVVINNRIFCVLGGTEYAIGAPNTEVVTNAVVAGNWIWNNQTDSDDLIDFQEGTSCTGIVANNLIRTLDTDGTAVIATGMGCFENYTTAVDNASGFLLPAADS